MLMGDPSECRTARPLCPVVSRTNTVVRWLSQMRVPFRQPPLENNTFEIRFTQVRSSTHGFFVVQPGSRRRLRHRS